MTGIEQVATAAGVKTAGPIVASAIQSIALSLRDLSSQAREKLIRDFRVGFSDFLTASYSRCQLVKTLISGDKPVPLTEIYVNLNLSCQDINIDDIDLIDNLEKYRRVVVCGLGGAGKSMLMKYLTTCRFEKTNGKIPLFVELRHLNSLTKKELVQFIYSSCTTAKGNVKFETFDRVMQSGGFFTYFGWI